MDAPQYWVIRNNDGDKRFGYLLHRLPSGDCIVATDVGFDYEIVRCTTDYELVRCTPDQVVAPDGPMNFISLWILRTLQAFTNSLDVHITATPAYYNWQSIQQHVAAFGNESRVRSRCNHVMQELIGTALRPSRIERLIAQYGMDVLDTL